MAVTLQDLLESGVHFGHQTKRWNPKMKPFIFTARNGIYIIDLQKTLNSLEKACQKVKEIVGSDKQVLFVGTKKQAKEVIKEEALRCSMPFVTERWLGGMMTNFQTIRRNIKRLKDLERMKEDGTFEKLTKKEASGLQREIDKLENILGGIKDITRLPGAVFVVDSKKEKIAVAEANKLKIPVIAIIDTNSDPDVINYPIAGNDDAVKSIKVISHEFSSAILEAQHKQMEEKEQETKKEIKVKSKEEE